MTHPQRTIVRSQDLPWSPVDRGVEEKALATRGTADPYSTSIVRLDGGAALRPLPNGWKREFLVLAGAIDVGDTTLPIGTFARQLGPAALPPGFPKASPKGGVLFLKTCPLAAGIDPAHFEALDTHGQPWSPGQGNLGVKPLSSSGGEGTALVHWPAGERFVPHQHFGGEEILVLSGTFRDEHGAYPEGTWIRSAHLSRHHPFVEEETVIYVKTGHLHPSALAHVANIEHAP